MTQRLLIIIGLLCLFSVAQAQEDEVPSPILNADDVFGEHITVLERLAPIYYDEQDIHYYDVDTETWISYPIPVNIAEIQYIEQRSNGEILVSSEMPISYYDSSQRILLADRTWIFNPVDGTFQTPQTTCGGYVQDLPAEGDWIVSNFFDDGFYHLCHTETGEISLSLPDELQTIEATYCRFPQNSNLHSSPSLSYVVIVQCQLGSSEYHIHTYDIAGRQFTQIGSIVIDNAVDAYQRIIPLNETEFVVVMGDLQFELYKADATQSNSLRQIAFMSGSFPRFYPDPPRYIFFDFNDGYLYLTNLETEETTPLFNYQIDNEGHIPRDIRVHSLSPDGRYLAYGYYANWTFHSYIVDLETGNNIYYQGGYQSYELYHVLWTSSTTVIVYMAGLSGTDYYDVFRVDIGDTVETEQVTTIDSLYPNATYERESPDNRFIPIIRTNTEYQLYDVEADNIIEVLSLPDGIEEFQVHWIDNDKLLVQVGINKWRIQFDAISGTDT